MRKYLMTLAVVAAVATPGMAAAQDAGGVFVDGDVDIAVDVNGNVTALALPALLWPSNTYERRG